MPRPSPPKLVMCTRVNDITFLRNNSQETISTRCLSQHCDYYINVKFLAHGFGAWFVFKMHLRCILLSFQEHWVIIVLSTPKAGARSSKTCL